MKKKELSNKINILERQIFLNVYNEFEKWLASIKYRPAKCFGEDTITDSNTLIHRVHTLYGIEHYVLDALDMHLYFVRERYNHVFYFINGFNMYSLPHTMDEFKAQILKDTKYQKEAKLKELDLILTIN